MNRSGHKIIRYIINTPVLIHNNYAKKYIFCELLLLCSVVRTQSLPLLKKLTHFLLFQTINIVMWELFFEGFFWNFLPAILSAFKLDWTVWSIHSSLLFPKIAKCEYLVWVKWQHDDVRCNLCFASKCHQRNGVCVHLLLEHSNGTAVYHKDFELLDAGGV